VALVAGDALLVAAVVEVDEVEELAVVGLQLEDELHRAAGPRQGVGVAAAGRLVQVDQGRPRHVVDAGLALDVAHVVGLHTAEAAVDLIGVDPGVVDLGAAHLPPLAEEVEVAEVDLRRRRT